MPAVGMVVLKITRLPSRRGDCARWFGMWLTLDGSQGKDIHAGKIEEFSATTAVILVIPRPSSMHVLTRPCDGSAPFTPG